MLGVKPAQRAPDPPGAAEGCEHPAAALQGSHAAMKWDPGAIHPPCPIPGQQLEMARTRRTSMPTRPDCSSPPGAFGSFESSSTRLNLPERKGLCVREGLERGHGKHSRRLSGVDAAPKGSLLGWDGTTACPYAKYQEPSQTAPRPNLEGLHGI